MAQVTADGMSVLAVFARSRVKMQAEIVMLRKQLAFYHERNVRPRRMDDGARLSLVLLSRFLPNWESSLVIVRPATLIHWHRCWARLLWRRKSRYPGRPRVPHDVQVLIRQMAVENPLWGEETIRNEILLKTGVQLSPRTVRKYMPKKTGNPRGDQRWTTFVRNHARTTLAFDLFTVWTIGFTTLYVFVILEIGSRKIIGCNVTRHPSSPWIIQQLRQAIPCENAYRFLIHDRDSTFSKDVDAALTSFGIRPLKTPVHAPQANAYCERLIGTMRRQCVDHVIPLGERHLRSILSEWVAHYNCARPHSSLGPGIPDPAEGLIQPPTRPRHSLPEGYVIRSKPVLGGLHHHYTLEKPAA